MPVDRSCTPRARRPQVGGSARHGKWLAPIRSDSRATHRRSSPHPLPVPRYWKTDLQAVLRRNAQAIDDDVERVVVKHVPPHDCGKVVELGGHPHHQRCQRRGAFAAALIGSATVSPSPPLAAPRRPSPPLTAPPRPSPPLAALALVLVSPPPSPSRERARAHLSFAGHRQTRTRSTRTTR